MNLDIYLVGVGGQGVLTIAELIMRAALNKNMHCNYFPTKGMAQRGGFVKAQLRLSDVPKGPDISAAGADIVIAMEQNEALKAIDYLKPGGDMIVYGYQWQPTEVMLKRAPYPDADTVKTQAQKRAACYTYLDPGLLPADSADNIYLLSAAQKNTKLGDCFNAKELLEAVFERFPKGVERNEKSFALGQE